MMNTNRSLAAFLLISALSATAWAQGNPPPPPTAPPSEATQPGANPPNAAAETGPGWGLLDNDFVRLELKLTPEQQQKIGELIQSARNDIQSIRSKLPSQEQRQQILKQVEKRVDAVYQNYRQKVEDILTPEQRARLREITIRLQGMRSVDNADIAAALNLTDEQKTKIQNAVQHFRDTRHDIIRSSRGEGKTGRQERREKLAQNRTELDQTIRGVLTPEQLSKFEQMKGAQFDTSRIPTEEDAEQISTPRPGVRFQ
jgi:Spy/CpxP family protein refolding chaperone